MPEFQTILTYKGEGSASQTPGEGQALALHDRVAFFIVARGPVPRDRCMARDRPSPYGEGARFFP